MDTPTYRILWPAATIALPRLQDFQVSVPIHIPAEFMRSTEPAASLQFRSTATPTYRSATLDLACYNYGFTRL